MADEVRPDPKPAKPVKPLPVPESVFWKAPGYCRSCGKEIWWWKNPKTGSWTPVTAESTNHFIDCPQRKDWRKK